MMPKITVVVPVYKVEEYLDRCISSIINQTFKDFELILVDDGSPDNCPQMCEEWKKKDDRVLVIHQENQGLSAARNSGIKIAKGEYLTFVDSDDWISATMLEDLYRLSIKYKADISVCNFVRTDCQLKIEKNNIEEKIYNQEEFMKVILKVNSNRTIHYAWAKLYHREVIDVDHYPVGMLNEDVEGMFKAVMRSKTIVETNKIGYFYFENSESITRKKFGENFLSLNDVWNRIENISKKEAPKYLRYVQYNAKRIDFTILCDSILYGDKETDRLFNDKISLIRKRLKKNILELMRSPMRFDRKFLTMVVAYGYYPIRLLYRKIK